MLTLIPWMRLKNLSSLTKSSLLQDLYSIFSSQHATNHQPMFYSRRLCQDMTTSRPMRPKGRGVVQHGGPPGWLEKSELGRCDFVRTGRTACLFRTIPVALTEAAQLRPDGISSSCYIYIAVNVHNHLSWATSRKEGMPGTLVDPCLLSGLDRPGKSHRSAVISLCPLPVQLQPADTHKGPDTDIWG